MKLLGIEIKRVPKAKPDQDLDPLMARMDEIEPLLTDLHGKHTMLAHVLTVDITGAGFKQLMAKGQWDEVAKLVNQSLAVLAVGKKVKAIDCEFTQQPRYKTEIR